MRSNKPLQQHCRRRGWNNDVFGCRPPEPGGRRDPANQLDAIQELQVRCAYDVRRRVLRGAVNISQERTTNSFSGRAIYGRNRSLVGAIRVSRHGKKRAPA